MHKEEIRQNNNNPLAPVVSKLISIIVLLVVFMVGLVILLVVFVPTPSHKEEKKIETPVPDEFGNFTESAKLAALNPKDTVSYWKAPDEATLEKDQNKDLIKQLIASHGAQIKESLIFTKAMDVLIDSATVKEID